MGNVPAVRYNRNPSMPLQTLIPQGNLLFNGKKVLVMQAISQPAQPTVYQLPKIPIITIVTLAHNADSRNLMDNQVVVGLTNLEQAVLQRPHLGATLDDFLGKPLLKRVPVVTDDASFESANKKLGDPQQFDLLVTMIFHFLFVFYFV